MATKRYSPAGWAIFGLLYVTACSQPASPAQKGQKMNDTMFTDINGMMIGDAKRPAKPFYVSLGDSAKRLRERNPYLPEIYVDSERGFELPLITTLNLHYEDGDLHFEMPCVSSADVSGRNIENTLVGFDSVRIVGANLCDPALNDWTKATKQAALIAQAFEKQNPGAVKAQILQKQLSHQELAKISRALVGFRNKAKPLELLEENEANQFFAKIAAEGHQDQFDLGQGTYIDTAAYLGKNAVFTIGISKNFFYGGREKLAPDIRDTMKYSIGVAFIKRQDL